MNYNNFHDALKASRKMSDGIEGAANIASSMSYYLRLAIADASKDAPQSFKVAMEPYFRRMQFYEGLSEAYRKRMSARMSGCRLKLETSVDINNLPMFEAVFKILQSPSCVVEDASSPFLFGGKGGGGHKRSAIFEMALSVTEISAAILHDMHPMGHYFGPAATLVKSFLELFRRSERISNSFVGLASFFSRLDHVDACLNEISVGVYSIPDFWPYFDNLNEQREKRGDGSVDCLSQTSCLPRREVEEKIKNLLLGSQVKSLLTND